jgi:hypothetical protein
MSEDLRAIACNLAVDESACAKGALAYIQNLSNGRARILVRSRSGRWIEAWKPIKVLANFRFRTVPEHSPLFCRLGRAFNSQFISEEYLQSLALHGAGQDISLR